MSPPEAPSPKEPVDIVAALYVSGSAIGCCDSRVAGGYGGFDFEGPSSCSRSVA